MSRKPETPPSTASGRQESDSVFDFLYHDPLRIASFLGQFDPSGVAQSLKRTDQTARTSTDGSSDSIKLSAGVISGNLGGQIGFSEGAQHGSERTYDPLWSNARAFLDYLEQKSMVERDILEARIGQFVLFKGDLSISDLTLLKEAWKLPQMRKLFGVEDAPVSKHRNSSAKLNNEPNTNAFALDILSILPHSVQATVSSSLTSVWANLKPDCLATEPSDLTLKHGHAIPGTWSILGILDAQPQLLPDAEVQASEGDAAQAANILFRMLAPVTRNIMGRPLDAFAVTPLLVFREVTGPNA